MKFQTKDVVEVAVSVALAFVLSLFAVYQLPQGGSISLEMVPIFLIAFRRGGRIGIWAGCVLGLLKLFVEPYIVHPVQLVMDYPLPFALVGLAGFFPHRPVLGVLVGSTARLATHILSGVIFFGSYAPEGANVWVYSAGYNASYLIPEAVLAIVAVLALWRTIVVRKDA